RRVYSQPRNTANRHASAPRTSRFSPVTIHKPPFSHQSPVTSHESRRSLSPFRINTYTSVASKRLYPPLESTLMKKPGGGGGAYRSQILCSVGRHTLRTSM